MCRSLEHADFLEGIRARIIDKDNSPRWKHASAAEVRAAEVQRMLSHLGEEELIWNGQLDWSGRRDDEQQP